MQSGCNRAQFSVDEEHVIQSGYRVHTCYPSWPVLISALRGPEWQISCLSADEDHYP